MGVYIRIVFQPTDNITEYHIKDTQYLRVARCAIRIRKCNNIEGPRIYFLQKECTSDRLCQSEEYLRSREFFPYF